MSPDTPNSNNHKKKPPSPPPADMQHHRRSSVTSAALANLLQRSTAANSTTPVFPGAITTAAINEHRRRLSLSTTSLGLSGTSPTASAAFNRRASLSTNSDSVDDSAFEEDDTSASRTVPVSPFTRRMSFGTSANMRRSVAGSPASANDQGYNWSEQLRSRAESTVASGRRPSVSYPSAMSSSPPRTAGPDRTKPASEMPAPPAQPPKPRSAPRDTRPKPDAFQERILKGDFYMD